MGKNDHTTEQPDRTKYILAMYDIRGKVHQEVPRDLRVAGYAGYYLAGSAPCDI